MRTTVPAWGASARLRTGHNRSSTAASGLAGTPSYRNMPGSARTVASHIEMFENMSESGDPDDFIEGDLCSEIDEADMDADADPQSPASTRTVIYPASTLDKGLVHWYSVWRLRWDLLLFFQLIYTVWLLPIRICFGVQTDIVWSVFDALGDVLQILDIVAHCCTTYDDMGREITSGQQIRRNYLKGRFVFDLIGVLPVDWVVRLVSNISKPMLRVNRLIRIHRGNYYYNRIENLSSDAISLRMGRQAVITLMLSHTVACCFFAVLAYEDPPSTAFIGLHNQQANMMDLPVWSQYMRSVYWAFISMTGYGNTVPVSFLESVFSLFVVVLGVGVYVSIIGAVGSLLATMDASTIEFRHKMDMLQEYMRYRKLPLKTKTKIQEYYNHLWHSRQGMDEGAILLDLPPYLQLRVSLFLNKDIIEKVPLFQNANQAFKNTVILHLLPRVEMKNSIIFRKGDIGREMFFINSGTVQIVSEDHKTVFAELSDGGFFGEVALLYHCTRTATVKAGSNVDLFVLTKEAFEEITQEYPEESKILMTEAKVRYDDPANKK